MKYWIINFSICLVTIILQLFFTYRSYANYKSSNKTLDETLEWSRHKRQEVLENIRMSQEFLKNMNKGK